jgi:NADH:ubiquinone oxidoreductase subunit E
VTAVQREYGTTPGETTEDGELSLGSCALAPVTVLDDQVMGRLRPEVLLCTLSNPTNASDAHCARAIVPSMRSPAKEVKYT